VIVSLAPFNEDGLVEAIESVGAKVGDLEAADALVWTDPSDPQALKDTLDRTPARWIQLPFAGIEKFVAAGAVDTEHLWTCTKGVYGPACAEHALALMLAASRYLQVHARAKTWVDSDTGGPERRMAGATAVVVGTGGIGAALVPLLAPLDVDCIGVNRSGRPLSGARTTVTSSELDSVLPEADYVVVAASMTPETKGMFSTPQFDVMKDDSWLVNVARGGLVETDALVAALREGAIGGAALDVTDPEPLPDGHPLWDLTNALITPHIANTWDMALPELTKLVRRNVEHFGNGEELEGLVDPEIGY
jgi:D-3-phosphoglycerate dehydrogenase